MNWNQAVSRWVAEAQQILLEHGFPTTWPEIQEHEPPASRLLVCAVQIVAGADYLRQYVAKGQTERALDRFLNVCIAVDEMREIALLATPEVASSVGEPITRLRNRPPMTRENSKALQTGFKQNCGAGKGRLNRTKVSKQEIEATLDSVYAKHPTWRITALRDAAADRLGITRKTIENITKHNPAI